MFTVTDGAKELIAKALEMSEVGDDEALRIYVTDDGEFEMGVDLVHDDDEVIRDGGRPLVLVDPDMTWELEGATLDAQEGPEGLDLMLDLPDEEQGGDSA